MKTFPWGIYGGEEDMDDGYETKKSKYKMRVPH